MHMADALLSPAVGGTAWAATAATIALCARQIGKRVDDHKLPLMGVLGAFIFAAQMSNLTINGTGSSGQLGGGLLLAILLGPCAAFITIASVLTVQALFFADGGLLALGCNIFNLGIFPCFVAYPLIYRRLVGNHPTSGRILAASLAAAVVGLQLGALAVVVETHLSGISALPLKSFALLMQPIHLAIGLVEGAVTAAVVGFLWKAQPDILDAAPSTTPIVPARKLLLILAAAALVTGGSISWFASSHPDGLEWAILHITGHEDPAGDETTLHHSLAELQEKSAILPDYQMQGKNASTAEERAGTSLSGLIGALLTFAVALLAGKLLRRRPAQPRP